MLDYLSRETDHEIVLISAAMGNAGAIAQWLSPDGQALRYESQWRGPRRLHAAFTTKPHWDETHGEQLPARQGLAIPAHHPAQRPDTAAHGRRPYPPLNVSDTDWQLARKSKSRDTRQSGLKQTGRGPPSST